MAHAYTPGLRVTDLAAIRKERILPLKGEVLVAVGDHVTAEQVVASGVGLRLPFARPRPAALREAVLRVLHEPEFKGAAERVRRSFEEAGGPPRAARELAGLAERPGESS